MWTEHATHKPDLTLYGDIKIAEQWNGQLYSNMVIGTLAIDVWAVTFGIAKNGVGGLKFVLFNVAL